MDNKSKKELIKESFDSILDAMDDEGYNETGIQLLLLASVPVDRHLDPNKHKLLISVSGDKDNMKEVIMRFLQKDPATGHLFEIASAELNYLRAASKRSDYHNAQDESGNSINLSEFLKKRDGGSDFNIDDLNIEDLLSDF